MTVIANNALRVSAQYSLYVYAIIRDINDLVWNGTEFVEYDGDDFDDYKVHLDEQGSSGRYRADFPSGIAAGLYDVTYHSATTPPTAVQTDDVIFQVFDKSWDGSTFVDDLVSGTSQADICNMALGHVGSSSIIANLISDTTPEAAIFRVFFDIAVKKCLRDFVWPFATRAADLALVEEDPTDEWAYSYRLPANCLKPIRILSGARNDNATSRVPFRRASDDAGDLIYTDQAQAQLEYVSYVSNSLRYPPDFTMMVSLLLAAYVAPKLAGGDPNRLGDRALKLYLKEQGDAMTTAANEEVPEFAPESSFVTERD